LPRHRTSIFPFGRRQLVILIGVEIFEKLHVPAAILLGRGAWRKSRRRYIYASLPLSSANFAASVSVEHLKREHWVGALRLCNATAQGQNQDQPEDAGT
jgi:hypothetical protein